MKGKMSGRVQMITSMIIFGTIGVFVRHVELASGELALYRAVMAAVLIGGGLLLTRRRPNWQAIRKELWILMASGAAMGINWILLFQAYRYTTVSVATLSYYFAPVLVTILSPILFRERLTRKQVLCFVISTVGLVLITGITGLGEGTSGIGILYGLGAACFYATVMILNKYMKQVSGIWRTLIQFVAAIIVLTPYVAVTGGFHLNTLESGAWIWLLLVGVVHTALAYVLYFSALKGLHGQEIAILSYLDPLVAVVISVAFLREPFTWVQAVGGVLVLGSTLWNELSVARKG